MKIAYICWETEPKYADEEIENNELLLFLQNNGLDIHKEIWTDSNVNWKKYDLAVLKAPWDYHEKIDMFYSWLDRLEKLSIPLLNPPDVIKWNSDKHYLKEIADTGLPVTPTLYLEKGSHVKLEGFFNKLNTDKLIIKPCISGGSKNTFSTERKEVKHIESKINELLKTESYMVQPFLKEILSEGEWTFLFFNGQFSHCLLKKPVAGDFRVQMHFGGSVHAMTPPAEYLKSASAYVSRFAKNCLYARVDGTILNNRFLLMELELIDPYLYITTDSGSCENYYKALKQRIDNMK